MRAVETFDYTRSFQILDLRVMVDPPDDQTGDRREVPDDQAPGDHQPAGRVGALPFVGLRFLEACCFVGAAGGVAGAVRMSAGARQRAAIDDQVFLADRTTIKPAL